MAEFKFAADSASVIGETHNITSLESDTDMLSQIANFSLSEATCDHQEEVSFESEQELCVWDSEDESTLTMEALETPLFNLLLNIYNQESGQQFKGYLYELLPLMV